MFLMLLIYFVSGPAVYSQTKLRVPLRITFTMYELINGNFFEPTSYLKNAIMNDYWNTERTSSSKSMADGFNVKKNLI